MKKLLIMFVFAVLSSTTFAQSNDNLIILFESDEGFRLGEALDEATVSLQHRADLNLDGVRDLTLLRLDEQDNPVEIITLDVASDDTPTLWQYSYQDITTALGTSFFRFMGFFTFSAGGPRR